MRREPERRNQTWFLGIECGGTRSAAKLANADGLAISETNAGAANLRLLGDSELVRHFRALAPANARPGAIAIGMAGARTDADRKRILRSAAKVWPGVPCYATNDLETALMAAQAQSTSQRNPRREIARVLVLSGTGSCCFGRTPTGKTVKIGGWGHVLGDKGSAYEIGLRALKAVVFYFDRDGVWPGLGQRLLRTLQLNEPNDLIGWVQTASKSDVAALAVEVFAAWRQGDRIAADIIEGAAQSLARDGASCARRLVKVGPVQFVLAGGVLTHQPRFARQVSRKLQQLWRTARVTTLERESVWGAVELAKQQFNSRRSTFKAEPVTRVGRQESQGLSILAFSPTEQRNPRSTHLDTLPLGEAMELMLREDARIPSALRRERDKIRRALELIVRAFRRGGRLFYVGAGTSGRLGVLDASECPPTFRTPPDWVQGIMAGGQRALWEAVEGAEDDAGAGAQAMAFRGVRQRDVVVGITASGRTPFVWGALGQAKRIGAATILLCFNPKMSIPPKTRPTLVIAPNVGPEILTGSTRLKAGTATKLILNIFTTLAMVRLGKVRSNLMIDVNASNTKLRERATRIVQELTGVDQGAARKALEKKAWDIKAACAWLKRDA
jgi:N-acetylmuramic acid 6-phosphate etherase